MSYKKDQVVTGPLGAGATTKPLDHLKRKPKVTELIKQGRGRLTDLSANHEVELQWDLNESANRDKVFKLVIDDKYEVYLDLEELTFYTRVMFMKG
jgi:hypothetical protein